MGLYAVFLIWALGCSGEMSSKVNDQSTQRVLTELTCESASHETTSLGASYTFDLDCAIAYFEQTGCDFGLDPDGNGAEIPSSTLEDLFNDPVSCKTGSTCSGCGDADSLATVEDCATFAAFSYFTENAWSDMAVACPADGLADPVAGCSIEGLSFSDAEMSCAIQYFANMTCDSCAELFDSRICEDAINNPLLCTVGGSCTGCTDGDARDNGVTCEEIAAYSYLGPSAAADLLAYVQNNPCDAGECVPDCTDRTCGLDGCGGLCGECGDGETCDVMGQCVDEGCTIEGVFFESFEADCARQTFETMTCDTCNATFDSRICEDALNDPVGCTVGETCTGCTDDDTRDDGVTCAEVAGYAYFGATSAQQLLDLVRADPTCGAPDMVVEGVPLTQEQVTSILTLVNGASLEQLDGEAGLDSRAAQNIIDAVPIATIEDVAAVPYVATTAIEQLRDYAPIWVPPGLINYNVSVQTLADEAAGPGLASAYYGQIVSVNRAIVTSEPYQSYAGATIFEIADPSSGNVEQLKVYVNAGAGQDLSSVSLYDDLAITGEFTQYGQDFELALADAATHSVSINKSGVSYSDYAFIRAAWHSTAANPEGSVLVEASFGYLYTVPLPLFLDHPMWLGNPPGSPADSGNEQDHAWNGAAQTALNTWLAAN